MSRFLYITVCTAVLLFLLLPLLVIIPLSFSSGSYLTLTQEMIRFEPNAYSLKWYQEFFASETWHRAVANTMIVGISTTVLSSSLGTAAAIGLADNNLPLRGPILGVLVSPMIIPVVVTSAGLYFAFSTYGITQSLLGLVLAHSVLAVPMVVLTVSATLVNFDRDLIKASHSLSASPVTTFWRVTLPLILPGVVSGAVFAFATSLDEVVATLFLAGVDQRTIPLQMWSGIREQLSPTILAAATMLTVLSIALLFTVQSLKERSAKRMHAAF
ncbi:MULTISPECIES: ABC transporter permease [unclassified Caballeronia]|uniref:ABC transporter permease n=1 Tax=unclassified Caballeronia TaxID=2646786 RepID=UPI0020279915|nr:MULTISPECIES: ABC transporter permease [unclassified Caballeronia]